MTRPFVILGVMIATLSAASNAAWAHPGPDHLHGFAEGLAHPLTGIDHVMAMLAVGLLAAQLGGRAVWTTPLAFLGMMLCGGILGLAGASLPFSEVWIAASVAVLGLTLSLGIGLSRLAAAALVGALAVFHGYGHGLEMPAAVNGLAYALGFLATSGLLHLGGIVLGLAARRAAIADRPVLFRAMGGSFALVGAVLLFGRM